MSKYLFFYEANNWPESNWLDLNIRLYDQTTSHRKKILCVYIYWFKKWFQKPVWFLLANRAVFRWKQFIMHYLLLQIILAAVSITLLQECQGFPNENWPFFFLMLQSCILVRLLLLHWCKSQSPNFLVLGKWKHERMIKLSLSPHLWKIKLLWFFWVFFWRGGDFYLLIILPIL